MPELPEITAYVEALERTIGGQQLAKIRVRSPSLVRTWDPPLSTAEGLRILALRRIGKRIVWAMEEDLYLVFHLMITGRFKWTTAGASVPKKRAHGAFDFLNGTLLLTEQSPKKRASLHVAWGPDALAALDPGGIEVLEASLSDFAAALTRENRTLKPAPTDPRVLSRIGNAHSDEILLFAGLSPLQLTKNCSEQETARLSKAAFKAAAKSDFEDTECIREILDQQGQSSTTSDAGPTASSAPCDQVSVPAPASRARCSDRW